MKNMITGVLAVLVVLTSILGFGILNITGQASEAAEPTEFIEETIIEEEEDTPEETVSLDMVELIRTVPASLEEVDEALAATADRITAARAIYDNFLALGYAEDHPAVELARNELARAEDDYAYYEERKEEIKWNTRYEEYPTATIVWRYMSETLGWSDEVCAGVMGNMMAECGGQTLNLQWNIYSATSFYGLCQWHPRYFASLQGASLETQLEFLGVSTKDTFDGWAGDVFNCDYEKFLASEDCETAARLFCIVYERPSGYQTQRSRNARVAYNYFTN